MKDDQMIKIKSTFIRKREINYPRVEFNRSQKGISEVITVKELRYTNGR